MYNIAEEMKSEDYFWALSENNPHKNLLFMFSPSCGGGVGDVYTP